MWFESQNCAMMGLQTTASKRKLEAATAPSDSTPAKSGRWEADDCIARLRAVAVPGESSWRPPTPATFFTATTTSSTAVDDFVDDDDDFDDELSSDDDRFPTTLTPTPTTTSSYPLEYVHRWQWYQAPQQQTIRRDENGKSYLELGASPSPPPSPLPPPSPQQQLPPPPTLQARQKCCDAKMKCCHVPCYRQRRMTVLNMSMFKLARYRQCSDPSLRRSVLICNTLRRLEREMESEQPEVTYPSLPELSPPSRPLPVVQEQPPTITTNNYEYSLREMTSSGRATPFPSSQTQDTDSGIGDDETMKPINWGSVLSLSSQTGLEMLYHNDLYAELELSSGGSGEMFDWKDNTNEWNGFMDVLVGGT